MTDEESRREFKVRGEEVWLTALISAWKNDSNRRNDCPTAIFCQLTIPRKHFNYLQIFHIFSLHLPSHHRLWRWNLSPATSGFDFDFVLLPSFFPFSHCKFLRVSQTTHKEQSETTYIKIHKNRTREARKADRKCEKGTRRNEKKMEKIQE